MCSLHGRGVRFTTCERRGRSTRHRGAAERRGVVYKYAKPPSCASAAVGHRLVIVTALASGRRGFRRTTAPCSFAFTHATFLRRRREQIYSTGARLVSRRQLGQTCDAPFRASSAWSPASCALTRASLTVSKLTLDDTRVAASWSARTDDGDNLLSP
eukprot:scaffold48134_cov63-Phaeocystis_antarctica.AAC.2